MRTNIKSQQLVAVFPAKANLLALTIFKQRLSISGWFYYSTNIFFFAAAASEPEANERSSSLISRRLHYRGLQSLFLTKRKELWLCANGRFRMRGGMRKELWLCANGNILGCVVIWRNEVW